MIIPPDNLHIRYLFRPLKGCAHDPRRFRWSLTWRHFPLAKSHRIWVYTPWGAFFLEFD